MTDATTIDETDTSAEVVDEPVAADEALRQIVGSGDPEYQRAAKEAAIRRVGEDVYEKDPEMYWTAQHGGMPNTGTVTALGPQLYHPAQLPDPAIARAAGIPPQNIPSHLVLDPHDWSSPKGPEPGEMFRLAFNYAVNERMADDVAEAPADSERFTMTSDAVQSEQEVPEPASQPEPPEPPAEPASAPETQQQEPPPAS